MKVLKFAVSYLAMVSGIGSFLLLDNLSSEPLFYDRFTHAVKYE